MSDPMDTRLRDAGAAWRADNDSSVRANPAGRAHRNRWLPAAAAAAVLLAVAGTVLALRAGDDRTAPASEAGRVAGRVWTSDDVTFIVHHGGAFVADSPCGVLTGRAHIDGDRLRVADRTERAKGCPGGAAELDEFFAHPVTLGGAGSRLVLDGAGATLYAFLDDDPVPVADQPTLTEATWRGTSATDATGRTVPFTGQLRIADGVLAASDSCNSYSADTTVVDDKVTPAHAQLDTHSCPGGALAGVVDFRRPFRWQLVGSELKIESVQGSQTYRWAPDDIGATDREKLVGRVWKLAEWESSPVQGPVTLSFPTSTSFEVASSCGSYRGSARIDSGSFTLDDMPGTRECTGSLADQAHAVAARLDSSPLWRITHGQLLVYGDEQGASLVFDEMSRRGTAPPAGPVGAYRLESVTRGGRELNTPKARIIFGAGQYRVDGACAARSGRYLVTADGVRLLPGPTRLCSSGPLDAIGGMGRLTGDHLVFANDGVILRFSRT